MSQVVGEEEKSLAGTDSVSEAASQDSAENSSQNADEASSQGSQDVAVSSVSERPTRRNAQKGVYGEYAAELRRRAEKSANQNRKPRRRPADGSLPNAEKKRKKENRKETYVDLKTRRTRLFDGGYRDITRIIERLVKIDQYEHFVGHQSEDNGSRSKKGKKPQPGTILWLMDQHEKDRFVSSSGRSPYLRTTSHESKRHRELGKKRKRNASDDDSNVSGSQNPEPQEDNPEVVRALTHVIHWDAFEKAFEEFLDNACKAFDITRVKLKAEANESDPPKEDKTEAAQTYEVGSPGHIAHKLEKVGRELLLEKRTKYEYDAKQIAIDERVTELTRENKEPAMSKWQKFPYERRRYETLEDYAPAAGLTPDEAKRVMDKLNVAPVLINSIEGVPHLKPLGKGTEGSIQEPNRWVVQEEMKEMSAWQAVMKHDQKVPFSNWEPLELGKQVVERETWGIDCFTRRNIELVLETIDQAELRMAPAQMRWFLEGILANALNAQEPNTAYDMREALKYIRDRAHLELLALEEAAHVVTKTRGQSKKSAREVVLEREAKKQKRMAPSHEVIGLRIRVFWPEDVAWYSGKIVKYSTATKKHLVRYDDEMEEWVNLMKERFILPTLEGDSAYNKDISPQVLLAGVNALLKAIDEWGQHCFAVHPKGFGVLANSPIAMGSLVCNYVGELYPSWLWEEKERKEDAKRKSSGKVVLPDFWNMRMERPADSPGGYDLLYVDAAMKGNFASRMSHSCQPNCGAMTAVVNGRYCIAMRALRPIEEGEELTIDYNCVTDSDEEFLMAICLCGKHNCRGSFLYTTGLQQYMQVVNKRHTLLHRLAFLYHSSLAVDPVAMKKPAPVKKTKAKRSPKAKRVRKKRSIPLRSSSRVAQLESLNKHPPPAPVASEAEKKDIELPKRDISKSFSVTQETEVEIPNIEEVRQMAIGFHGLPEEDVVRLVKAGLKGSVCQGLPVWLLRYANEVLHFVELEEKQLPFLLWNNHCEKISKSSVPETEYERREAWQDCVSQARGVAQQRVTNLVVALDRARHTMGERISSPLANAVPDGFSARGDLLENPSKVKDPENVETEAMGSRPDGDDVEMTTTDTDAVKNPEISDPPNKLDEAESDLAHLCPWWVGDRCEARWCGDDAADYPGWYSATVIGVHSDFDDGVPPSLHIMYDTGEVDRVLMSPDVVRRLDPDVSKLSERLSEYDGLTVTTHQPPFTPLVPETIVSLLASSPTQSVASRLTRAVEEAFNMARFPSWNYVDCQHNPRKSSFWWNFETRALQLEKPNAYELSRVIRYMPEAVKRMHECLKGQEGITTVKEAKDLLRELRDILMRIPKLTGPDASRLEDQHQKAIDILTYLIHTESFFTVSESTPVSKQWVTQQKTTRDSKPTEEETENGVQSEAGAQEGEGSPKLAEAGPKKKKQKKDWKPRAPMSVRQQILLKLRRDEEEMELRMKEGDSDQVKHIERDNAPVPGRIANAPSASDRNLDLVYSWRKDRPPMVYLSPPRRTSSQGTTAALLSWIDQKCDDIDVFQMMGTAYVPPIESAYVDPLNPELRGKWKSSLRDNVIRKLSSNKSALDPWQKDTIGCFPCRAPLTGVDPKSWPPPLPPTELCGSPLFDAAMIDNADFVKHSKSLPGELGDVQAKMLSRLQEAVSKGSSQLIANLVSDLKQFKRPKTVSGLGLYEVDAVKVTPPVAPTKLSSTWIRCERGNCRKWRRIPIGSGLRNSKDFACSDLKGYDDLHAKCSIPQEEVEDGMFESGVDALDLEEAVTGQLVDGFSTDLAKWRPAVVVSTTSDQILLHFLGYPLSMDEWIPKKPTHSIVQAAPAGIHTRSQLGEDQMYAAMVPAGCKEVAAVVSDLVQDVTRACDKKSNESKASNQWSFPEVSAFPRFLAHQRSVAKKAGELITFATVLRRWEAMTRAQKKLWGKVARAKFSRVTPRTIARFEAAMPTLDSLVAGNPITTNLGQGIIVKVVSHNLIIVAVDPRPGMEVVTPYGNGLVLSHDSVRNITKVQLSWGVVHMAYMRNAVPFFISTPSLPSEVQVAIRRFRATGSYDDLFSEEATKLLQEQRERSSLNVPSLGSPIGPVVIAKVKNPRGPPRAAVKPPNLSDHHEILWNRLLQLKNTELRTLLTTMKLSMSGNKATRIERIFEHELKTGELTTQLRNTMQAAASNAISQQQPTGGP